MIFKNNYADFILGGVFDWFNFPMTLSLLFSWLVRSDD